MESSRGVGFLGSGQGDPIELVSIAGAKEPKRETGVDYISALPNEIFLEVLNDFKGTALVASLYLNRQWFTRTSDSALWKKIFAQEGLPSFDDTKTRKYRGDPGEVPPLSWPRAYQFLHSTCTLEPGSGDLEPLSDDLDPESYDILPAKIRFRKDTHKLQLHYKELGGIPTTMKGAGEHAKTPKEGSGGIAACFHKDSWEPALTAFGEEPLGEAFWAFHILKPLGSGEDKSLEKKLADAKLHPQYVISRPVERAIVNLDNVVEGHGYIEGPSTYAICEGILEHDFGDGVVRRMRVALGGARAPAGLDVSCHIPPHDDDDDGVALLWKF